MRLSASGWAVKALLVALAGSGMVGAATSDLVIADFEGDTYGAWTVEGQAFGQAPARGTLPNQMPVSGFQGRGLVNSFFSGDGTVGTLTSPEVKVERKRINFLVGGGNHPGETVIELLSGGEVVRSTTGPNSEFLRAASWNVSELMGKTVRIRIVDRHTGGWGHINVDQIVQSDDEPRPEDDRDGAIARAMRSVREAEALAAKDPARPQYHFRPLANWMNDPNGPIYYKGYYHLFYQHNPYGDRWGNMHWGHARSKDLVKWEHLPIALWPSKVKGEEHVFSGCAWVDNRGKPLLFYTSIGQPVPECWIAEPEDDELIRWKKHSANPVVTQNNALADRTQKLYEFRDPCVFKAGKQTFMVHGGNLNESKGGQAVVVLSRATNEALTAWEPAGILFKHPDPAVKNIECPLLFPITERGGEKNRRKWVLVTSPYRSPDWFVGDFDAATGKFTPTADGILDRGNYYAPNSLEDGKDRRVMWGWINGFPEGKGWNGCLTLPRVVTLGPDGRLRQNPAKELEKLRGQQLRMENADLTPPVERIVEQVVGESFELSVTFDLRDASSAKLRLRRSKDGRRAAEIRWDGKVLDVAGTKTTLRNEARAEPINLRVFLDHSVLEVYADEGRECVTKVLPYNQSDTGVSLVGDEKGTVRVVEFRYWPMKPIWPPIP